MEEDIVFESQHHSMSFPTVVACLSLAYNLLALFVSAYLPHDPLFIGWSVSAYAFTGCVISLLGLAGITKRRPTLITAFAHFLLLDTVLSAVSRLVALEFFVDTLYDDEMCTAGMQPSSSSQSQNRFSHHLVSSASWIKHGNRDGGRCKTALGLLQMAAIALFICVTAAQGTLAMTVRRYGKECERQRIEEKPEEVEAVGAFDDEKASLVAV